MRIYLAGWFGAQERLRNIRTQVEALGHEVVSSWLDVESECPVPSEQQLKMYASRDLYEIGCAHGIIVDTHDQSVTGGREVEFGNALARGLFTIIVGPHRNVFHRVADFHFADWPGCLAWLASKPVRLPLEGVGRGRVAGT